MLLSRWDKDSDKCLLIGVFKHGYEKYNLVRADSSLLFLTVCGPPDKKALRKEQLVDGLVRIHCICDIICSNR